MNVASITGDINVVDALLFGGPSAAMREEIVRDHASFVKTVDPTWGAVLLQKTNSLFNNYNGGAVIQMVQNALNNVAAIARPDTVAELKHIEDFQTAQSVMQGYVMAQPRARALYHKNLCDGYSDTYVDPCPGVIGFGHAQYEHVMNGVLEVPAANDADITCTNYASAWASETKLVLDISQQASLLNTFSNLDKWFDEGDRDPVSPWNTSL